ncbi:MULTISPECIES: 50S ribosomal protein L33 [Spiroplasma]|uniref:Large ribosomal subunit protein bL33 n=1 Tax=Spiroplasma floricola 23-6 TaxID=1336749 RepID=A0A2K8SEG2_9MOLU|nr:50S ribosomal protein L33 [Spiroplasma floricola]AUB31847.1 50s ribosomal protein L33 [Spiroplasma floricola 23-6]
MREGVILRCATCKEENYIAKNDKRKDKIEVKKHCFKCNSHQVHKQKK